MKEGILSFVWLTETANINLIEINTDQHFQFTSFSKYQTMYANWNNPLNEIGLQPSNEILNVFQLVLLSGMYVE